MDYKKKLIEVALPLSEINDASAYDKMPGIGPHPKGIHHWWARLPLPTARAILFASVVDDPGAHPEKFPTEELQNKERERLFGMLSRMMHKRLHETLDVYDEAHMEMEKHCEGRLPALFDPFAGGGSIPLEANRLGFEAHAGDLNPVAVLLNKCNLELVPRWLNRSPVNPEDRGQIGGTDAWRATHGLAADVRYYGRIVMDRARTKIGRLYPKVRLPKEYGGGEADVIAWIFARTVASPNPAVHGKQVPLMSTYWLSSKGDKLAWLQPIVNKTTGTYDFEVKTGKPKDRPAVSSGTKSGRGGFRCILTDVPISFDFVSEEGQRGRLGLSMVAVAAQGPRGRVFLNPAPEQIASAQVAMPSLYPETDLPDQALGFRVQRYGINKHWKMFTNRQLTAIVTLSDLVKEIDVEVSRDATVAGLSAEDSEAYARSVVTFLALAVDRCTDFNNALCRWSSTNQKVMNLFGRQAIPMVWDFAEANTLADSVGGWHTCCEYVADCVEALAGSSRFGHAAQLDAAAGLNGAANLLVSTDPPYYDNIGYAALSDFFYIWLRRTIGTLYPDLFSTVLVPKIPELTAAPERFDGDKDRAKDHFESGFHNAFISLRQKMDLRFPLTVYYAFKQEDEESGIIDKTDSSRVDLTTGWETLLEALISSGFQITATWPVRASQAWRMRAMGSNALASYIVLACRPRLDTAGQCSRREFITELKRYLPPALKQVQKGYIAPVDLAQAAIGPGMAVFSQYSKVIESDGSSMKVRTALALINQTLDEALTEQEGEFDADTRWAVAWFEQFGMNEGPYGLAETLSKAKNTGIQGLADAEMLSAKGGKVRLLGKDELPDRWEPSSDKRLTIWKIVQHLVRSLDKGGEADAASLLQKVGGALGEIARDLAYRLYTISERKKWTQEALAYNSLVISWPEITRLAQSITTKGQGELL